MAPEHAAPALGERGPQFWANLAMTSDKQLEASRQNALQSTGPNTAEGVEAIKLNALRHGLRSIQTVVPGEDPDAWEAYRAVVDDVKPVGALELTLAEQIAAKLWRIGRNWAGSPWGITTPRLPLIQARPSKRQPARQSRQQCRHRRRHADRLG